MRSDNKKPLPFAQNRLALLLGSRPARLRFYRQVLERRLTEAEQGRGLLPRVPHSRGLRLRLPGKPFHATPEFFFQEAGVTRFALPHENLRTGPGRAALIPAGMPHGETWLGPFFLTVIVMFQADGFSLHLGYLEKGRRRCGPFDRFPSNARMTFLRYAEEIAAGAAATRAGRQLRRGLFLAFLARLCEGMNAGAAPAEPHHPLMKRTLELIDLHFTRMDFSVTWLARELGCSPDHLSRLFRRHAGRRLMQFIHQKRTEYACHLLRESDMNMAETAWACGFSRPSYFNRIFRTYTGVPPRQARAALPGPGAGGRPSGPRRSPPARFRVTPYGATIPSVDT